MLSDMWSIGIVLLELIQLENPLYGKTYQEMVSFFKQSDEDLQKELIKPEFDEEFRRLLAELLIKDFNKRISAKDAMELPLFKSLRSTKKYWFC